ncbi:hypothetical protein HWV62_8136 [Athelia sp. TMB]|nr:hypothetical protein HWV62_23731 [Athelia sp. TMB]KAF7975983.1 hypothetical protein HWV62_8136 [Athelia sp. TMB]
MRHRALSFTCAHADAAMSTCSGGAKGVTRKINKVVGDSRCQALKLHVCTNNKASKRKREALGDVTTALNNKGKGKAAVGKGKDVNHSMKEKFNGVGFKTTKAISTTTTIRQGSKPLRLQGDPHVQPAVLEEVAEVQDEHAMAIDDHTIINRQVSTRSAGTSRRVIAVVEEDEEEASRFTKKPRPSSEAPQSAAQTFKEQLQQVSDAASADFHAINEEEPEADPEGDDWTDLDTEDADDPLMVSEYVVKIFKYMKEIKRGVCLSFI